MASDGIWDAMKNDVAVKSCRGLFTKEAARTIVKVKLLLHSFTLKSIYMFMHYIHLLVIPKPLNLVITFCLLWD